MTIVNITTENDADFYRSFIYQDGGGNPIDLTGSQLDMKLRRNVEDATVFLELSTTTGEIALLNPLAGNFTILIVKESLLELSAGDYAQSLIRTVSGLRTRIWHGILTNTLGPSR